MRNDDPNFEELDETLDWFETLAFNEKGTIELRYSYHSDWSAWYNRKNEEAICSITEEGDGQLTPELALKELYNKAQFLRYIGKLNDGQATS